MVPEIRATLERARAEPTLGQVIAAARRDEPVCASATWAKAIAERGVRRSFGAMLDHDDLERWHPQVRRVLLHHGLAPTTEAVETVAEALQEAYFEAAEMALDGRPAGVASVSGALRRAGAPCPSSPPPCTPSLSTGRCLSHL